MSKELLRRYEQIQVGMAARGQLDEFLKPHLWEELRQNLQRTWRKATGEPTATLHIEN